MRGNVWTGIAIGAGAVLFGPALLRSSRPALKQLLRAGLEGYGSARVAAARLAEEVEDLVAEVAYEMQDIATEAAAAAKKAAPAKDKAGG